MFSAKIPISFSFKIDNSKAPFSRPVIYLNSRKDSTVMWRNISKQLSRSSKSLSRTGSIRGFAYDSVFPDKFKWTPLFELNSRSNVCFPKFGFQKIGDLSPQDEFWPISARNQVNFNDLCFRSYASVAEAVAVSHTDVEEDANVNVNVNNVPVADEVQELLNEVRKEERRKYWRQWRHRRSLKGVGNEKYQTLRRRQVKMETEAWELAVKEYRDLLNEMCEQKLAPNLPYMKSLFLGWFEPLRDKIAEEQEFIRKGKSKAAYAKYFDQLPADMMAVITMHKLMGMLMNGGEHGCARMVQAALVIGDAIEQEIYYFFVELHWYTHGFISKSSENTLFLGENKEEKSQERYTKGRR
ncbi:DNA-directed RNA polymerase [Handroanthus impetiginosus]|uniref:DNA-directed RNA polymerase n=1 Tax=Handroanthus impetiginosus TaxID=429701 RepID=A0A2G9GM72_9LAMI|nr:DNA-directed RNA polymerase [Handroanthus impetiginosus]